MVFLVEGYLEPLQGSNRKGHMLEDCMDRRKVPEQLIISIVFRSREAYHASYDGFVDCKGKALLRW